MSSWIGEGGGSSISVSPVAPGPVYSPRAYSTGVNVDANLDDLIDMYRGQGLSEENNYVDYQNTVANQAYLDNLIYIKDHPPKTRAQAEASKFGINEILDAVFYASAIASVVPFPAFKIGGSVGMASANTARALTYGTKRERYRSVANLSRTLNRAYGQYTKIRR